MQDTVWPVGTGLHGTKFFLQPQQKKPSVFNNWMSFRMPLCQDAVWLVDTCLHCTPVSSTTTKTCVFNNWMSCKTQYDPVWWYFIVPLQPPKHVFLTTGCHAKPCMTRSWQYFMVPLQPQKRKRKKREVFLTTRCCAKCLCVRTLLQPVDTGLCVTSLLCVRTLLQPVDTGLCVTSLWIQVFVLHPLCQDPVTACGYRSLCYLTPLCQDPVTACGYRSLCYLTPLCQDPVTACRYRSLCYILCVRTLLQPVDTGLCVTSLLCVRTLLQPVDTGLCVTSSVSGPCYSLWIQVFVLHPLCQDPVTVLWIQVFVLHPLCQGPVTACRYRSLCYILCVRTLLQPVDTGLCVTSSVSGPCYSLWIQVFVLHPLCQDPVTACGYRSLCYILCVRILLQPVDTGLCVTSSVSGPCYSL